jgi:hypothetical protein
MTSFQWSLVNHYCYCDRPSRGPNDNFLQEIQVESTRNVVVSFHFSVSGGEHAALSRRLDSEAYTQWCLGLCFEVQHGIIHYNARLLCLQGFWLTHGHESHLPYSTDGLFPEEPSAKDGGCSVGPAGSSGVDVTVQLLSTEPPGRAWFSVTQVS